MSELIKAVYENGTLVLDGPLEIKEGSSVNVVVISESPVRRPRVSVAKRLAEIAALPLEGGGPGFSGRDHDRILYGKVNEK